MSCLPPGGRPASEAAASGGRQQAGHQAAHPLLQAPHSGQTLPNRREQLKMARLTLEIGDQGA